MMRFICEICGKVDELDKSINDPRYGLVCENCHKEVDDRPVKFPPSENTCVCCGEVIPEGRQVCAICETKNAGEAIARGMVEGLKEKDSPVDIHKIIDDAMEKRDRTVSIFISAENNAVSVNVYPVDHDRVQWIETEHGMICSNCGNCESTWDLPTYCSKCGELMHGVRKEKNS